MGQIPQSVGGGIVTNVIMFQPDINFTLMRPIIRMCSVMYSEKCQWVPLVSELILTTEWENGENVT